ncbi:MAG: response regulator [Alphaproteobacteria bacterium]|nr:response regulator [Alphaproteobacteria bacterium]
MYNVLIVEDDFLNRELVGEQMEEVANIESATNGAAALEKMREFKPDLVVLDLNMPVMNGFEFLASIREQGYKTPVVVLTAMDLRKDDYDFLRKAKVTRVFQKGRYSDEDLLASLGNALGG